MRKILKVIIVAICIMCFTTPVFSKCLVVIKNGNIRDGAGLNYKVIGKAEFGDFYEDSSSNFEKVGNWFKLEGHKMILNKDKTLKAWLNTNAIYHISDAKGKVCWLVVSPDKPTTFVEGEVIDFTGKEEAKLKEVLYHPKEYIEMYIHKSLITLKDRNSQCYAYLQKIKENRYRNNRIVKIRKYHLPSDIENLIIEKRIRIGMTKQQVILSWGKPERINRSVGSWGIHEQWIYGRTYVYFENGILTAWQD